MSVMTDNEIILQWLDSIRWSPSPPDIDWEDYEDEDPDDEEVGGEEFSEFDLSREPNRYEQKVDFTHLTDQLDTLEKQTKQRLVELLTDSKSAMLVFVERNWDTIGKALQDLRLKGMNDIQETIGEFLRQAYQIGWDSMGREVNAPISMDSMFTPKEALAYLKQKKFWVSGLLKDSVTKEIKAVILNAIKSGELPRETQQKIADAFEPYIGNESVLRDQKQLEPYRIETILRTNATDALNHGRLVRARQIPDLLNGMQYSAIIDSRTTEICRHLDGKVFRMDDPMLDSLTPPNHHNCRSVLVPVTIAEKVAEEEYANAETIGKARDLMDPGFGGSISKPYHLPGQHDQQNHGKGEGFLDLSDHDIASEELSGLEGTTAGWKKALGYESLPLQDDAYYYHATFKDFIPKIQKEGLYSQREFKTFPGYGTKPRVSLSPTVTDLEYWSELGFWSRGNQTRKYGYYVRPALLRVKKDSIKSIESPRRDELWTKNIASEKLELWNGSRWQELGDWR